MQKVMIGVCKYCSRAQPELNLCCIDCHNHEWDVDKKNVNATSNGIQPMSNKQNNELNMDIAL